MTGMLQSRRNYALEQYRLCIVVGVDRTDPAAWRMCGSLTGQRLEN